MQKAFTPNYDSLTPAQRVYLAKEWDYQHDPMTKSQRDEIEKFYGDYEKLKCEIAYWKNANAPTVLDMAKREEILAPLKARFEVMDLKYRQMLGDPTADDETITQAEGEQDGPVVHRIQNGDDERSGIPAKFVNKVANDMEEKSMKVTPNSMWQQLGEHVGNSIIEDTKPHAFMCNIGEEDLYELTKGAVRGILNRRKLRKRT